MDLDNMSLEELKDYLKKRMIKAECDFNKHLIWKTHSAKFTKGHWYNTISEFCSESGEMSFYIIDNNNNFIDPRYILEEDLKAVFPTVYKRLKDNEDYLYNQELLASEQQDDIYETKDYEEIPF